MVKFQKPWFKNAETSETLNQEWWNFRNPKSRMMKLQKPWFKNHETNFVTSVNRWGSLIFTWILWRVLLIKSRMISAIQKGTITCVGWSHDVPDALNSVSKECGRQLSSNSLGEVVDVQKHLLSILQQQKKKAMNHCPARLEGEHVRASEPYFQGVQL